MADRVVNIFLTLQEKESNLYQTIGVPTQDDWRLLKDADKLVPLLNKILIDGLSKAKSGELKTCGEIRDFVYGKIDPIDNDYPEAGIGDSEGRETVARFFALNYGISIYDFFRYYSG